jgi:zinc transport system substrate-binding protein
VAASALAVSGGCGGSVTHSARAEPPLEVVTTAFPLAQVVGLIGGGRAHVTDLVPPGSDPFTFRPTPAEDTEIQRAGLFVMAGQSVQPGVSADTATARPRLDVGTVTSEAYYWLDPQAMRQAIPAIETAMERAGPANAGSFRAGARALEVELDSTGIDYQSTLSTCPRRTLFAADGAFSAVARRYDLDFTALGAVPAPDAATITAESASVRSAGATTVFAETWVSASTVDAVAAGAGAKVRTLDTLLGPPPGGWPRQANYLNLLEANLGRLNDALGCAGSGAGA